MNTSMNMEASHPSCATAPVLPSNHKPALVPSSFLSLPAVVRKQIYLGAGLVSNDEIDLNGSRTFDYYESWSPERPFQVSHDLLLTCRAFYADIHPILYSTNAFYIQYRDKGNLERLRALSPRAIALMTQLTIYLKDSCRDIHPGHGAIRLPQWSENPLDTSCQPTIIEWQMAASHIINHIKPSILRLFLICDSANVETAQRVIEPLRSAPTLADCRIRLARSPNSSLQKLAREVSMQAKGYPSAESAFRILDLPPEIRLKVLEFTDLITPLREVEWSSEQKFGLRFSAQICGQIGCQWSGPCYPPRYPACQFVKCWHLDRENAGCFCHRHHAAFSSMCKCWAPPTSLFLVCKDLQHDAQTVFYSMNRFIIVAPSEECHGPVSSTPERLDISIFLRDFVPSQALSLLKFLDIVFPPFYNDYLGESDPAYQDWLQTINHLGNLATLPVLTLRVHMADIPLFPEHAPEYRTKLTREESQTIVKAYERAIKPLSKLRERGLDRFFADLTLPWGRTAESIKKHEEDPSSFTVERRGLRMWAERLVMGCEYDSTTLRFGEPEEPQWRLEAFEQYMV